MNKVNINKQDFILLYSAKCISFLITHEISAARGLELEI